MSQSNRWRENYRFRCDVLDAVWDFIHPVVPDHMSQVNDDLFEATWWKPVPAMDIEILQHTEGIIIIHGPYEPESIAGGLAVQFSIQSL